MQSQTPMASTNRRKKRVGTACDFCRQRKLGCDNAQPKCENCKFQGKNCTYSERVKKVRPTNTQIRRLEDENAQLRRSLARLRSQANPQRVSDVQNDQHGGSINNEMNSSSQVPYRESVSDSLASSSPSSSHKRLCFSTGDREVQFHGPSSAMFDESHQQTNTVTSSITTDPLHKFQLLGSSMKQRQMEQIDFAAGKLDFDGVDPEAGMQLLSVFWNRQHASGSIVYRPAFMRDMACQGPYFSKLLLNAIFFAASKNSPRPEHRCEVTDGPAIISPFRRKAEKMLYDHGSDNPMKSDIPTIQALLIMSDALFTWCDERSLSWLYSGLAMNMITELGLHVDSRTPYSAKQNLSTEDIEVRRRLFWAAFVADKVQSIYQGRPVRLREVDVNVPICFLDDYEELEQFSPASYSLTELSPSRPTHSVSIFEQLCNLSVIMDKIISSIYTEKSGSKDPKHLFGVSQSLHSELKRWRSALPEHLTIKSNGTNQSLTPQMLSLMCMFHSLIILLHRPFVSDGHIRATSASVVRESVSTCAIAASEIDAILHIYKQDYCLNAVPYFMSYATYVSATIHARIAAQSGPGSEAHRSLQHCLDILAGHSKVCRAPRRARQILVGLARRLNVDVNDSMDSSTNSRVDGAGTVPNSLALGESYADGGFDVMNSDIDIDAIIQSFNVEQSGINDMTSGDSALFGGNHEQVLPMQDSADGSEAWPFYVPLFGYGSLDPNAFNL